MLEGHLRRVMYDLVYYYTKNIGGGVRNLFGVVRQVSYMCRIRLTAAGGARVMPGTGGATALPLIDQERRRERRIWPG